MTAVRLSVLIKEASAMLSRVGISTPVLDSRLIAGHVCGMTDLEVLTHFDFLVSNSKVREFFKLVALRISGVPVSHILCKREFWSMDFMVGPDVLDPRPDTETIISTVINLYANRNQKLTIADLGTGTGCIITALLAHYKNARGVAFEKSVRAYRVARENLIRHGMLRKVKLHRASWDECEGKFDLIVSNPPYIRRCNISNLHREVRLHEPIQALDGGVRGMEKYLQIFKVLSRCLKFRGRAVLEIGEDQKTIRNEALQYGLEFCGYTTDLEGRKRCIIFRRFHI